MVDDNLYYAILQLGTTPTCEYAALTGQPLNTPVVVEFADPYIKDLGVGMRSATGITAIYRSRFETVDEKIIEHVSTSPDLGVADAAVLEDAVKALAAQYLSTSH
jgi:hypothetical protein